MHHGLYQLQQMQKTPASPQKHVKLLSSSIKMKGTLSKAKKEKE